MSLYSATSASILIPSQNGNVHGYATTNELKKKAFTIYSKNINQEIGIQVTFIFKINP